MMLAISRLFLLHINFYFLVAKMSLKRGALIVIEGLDRTGKSTQCKALVESLKKKHIIAKYINFPARHTEIGQVINSYLTAKKELPDEAIHLLFSANRWEQAKTIIKALEDGITIVIDRYCYSGVAFSAAKGLDLEWCKKPDAGLPRPDRVFFLTMSLDHIVQRNGFGNERYEVPAFQCKVAEVYAKLKDESWDVINASRSIQTIQDELLEKTLDIINNVEGKPIRKVWVE